MDCSRSPLSAFPTIINCWVQDVRSLIYFASIFGEKQNRRCSNYHDTSGVTKKLYDIIPLWKTVPSGPFRSPCSGWAASLSNPSNRILKDLRSKYEKFVVCITKVSTISWLFCRISHLINCLLSPNSYKENETLVPSESLRLPWIHTYLIHFILLHIILSPI